MPEPPARRWNLYIGGHLSKSVAVKVVLEENGRRLLWVSPESPTWEVELPGGGHLRDVPIGRRPRKGYRLRPGRWWPTGALIHHFPGKPYAVWLIFDSATGFTGWYVNFERCSVAGQDFHVEDHELDMIVDPDRRWRLKDETSFESKVDTVGYWSAGQARSIRAEVAQVAELIASRQYPFDDSLLTFQPPTDWAAPERPAQPRVFPPRAALPGCPI